MTKEKKSPGVQIRVSLEVRRKLKIIAARLNTTISDVVKSLLDNKA